MFVRPNWHFKRMPMRTVKECLKHYAYPNHVQDLAQRQPDSLGAGHAPRDEPRDSLWLQRVRGDPLLWAAARLGGLPASRAHAAPAGFGQDLPHGPALHA